MSSKTNRLPRAAAWLAVLALGEFTVQAGQPASTMAGAADLARGALLFQTCSACHTVLGAALGPDLTGIVGKRAGRHKGFTYSDAMKGSKLVWTEATLRAYIRNPQALVKGTTMTFPGYTDPADVENVLAYLKTLK